MVSQLVVSAVALSFATAATFSGPVASMMSKHSFPMFSPVGRSAPAFVAVKKKVYLSVTYM